jgi:hypothetical protein
LSKNRAPKPDDKEQSRLLIKKAREIGADEEKAQDYALSGITAGICDWRNGLQYKFALQKS